MALYFADSRRFFCFNITFCFITKKVYLAYILANMLISILSGRFLHSTCRISGIFLAFFVALIPLLFLAHVLDSIWQKLRHCMLHIGNMLATCVLTFFWQV